MAATTETRPHHDLCTLPHKQILPLIVIIVFMNSRDILDGFFSDASLSEFCSHEKFARECASSLSPDIAARLYELISEQHGKTLEEVQKNVFEGEFFPETRKGIANSASVGGSSESAPKTSISFLIECLSEAVKSSESHSEILQGKIDKQLEEARSRKAVLSQLVNTFEYPENGAESGSDGPTVLTEKCIEMLQRGTQGPP